MTIAQLDSSIDRPLPQSPDAERAVLGAILINPDAFNRVAPMVETRDFFKDAHRMIFEVIGRLASDGLEIDPLTVKEELAKREQLDKVGGSAYISSLTDGIPDIANVERYARFVRDKAKLRALIVEGNRVMREALDAQESAEEIAAGSALRMTEIAASRRDSGPVTVGALAKRSSDGVEARSLTGHHVTGIPFGLANLDGYTLGIQRRVESMLAARPRVGKTAFALALALHNAKAGNRVLLVELDMSQDMIGNRLLATESEVSYAKIRSGQFINEQEWKRIGEASRRLSSLSENLIVDYMTRDIAQISALVRREASRRLDLVIIDHVGHVEGARVDTKRYDLEVGYYSKRFIALAAETGAAWLTLVQLKREAENRPPQLSDLAESGKLEQDARLVVMLDRPHIRGEEHIPECQLDVYVPKNEGECGAKLRAHFDGDWQRVSQTPPRKCSCEDEPVDTYVRPSNNRRYA